MTDQERLVNDCIAVYESRDLTGFEPLFSADFKYQTFPKIVGLPDETREGYIAKYNPIFSKFAKVEIKIENLVDTPGKVAFEFSGKGTTDDTTEPIKYESLVVLTIVREEGSLKVSAVKDFSNAEKRANFYAWAARALV